MAEWLSLKELADELRVSPQVLYGLRYSGKGPRGARIGRELRFRRSDIDSWIATRSDDGPRAA